MNCARPRPAWLLWQALAPPLAVLAFWAVAAKGFDAYLLSPWLDVPTHFAGGIAGVWCLDVYLIEWRRSTGPVHPALRLALAFGVLACAAIGWEFLEYLSDVFRGTHLNLGVRDTLSDLFFGLLGGAWGVGVRYHVRRRASESRLRAKAIEGRLQPGSVVSGAPNSTV